MRLTREVKLRMCAPLWYEASDGSYAVGGVIRVLEGDEEVGGSTKDGYMGMTHDGWVVWVYRLCSGTVSHIDVVDASKRPHEGSWHEVNEAVQSVDVEEIVQAARAYVAVKILGEIQWLTSTRGTDGQ